VSTRDYRDYLQDIVSSIADIETFVGDMTLEDFARDKKTRQSQAEFFVDGKRASLADIVEASGDKELWKSYVERENDGLALHRYLGKYLGEYVTAREIHWPPGMKSAALRRWKKSGSVRAEHIRSRHYYSLQDILRAIKEEPNCP